MKKIVIVGAASAIAEHYARLEAANRGLADLPLALVPHPLGGIREDEVVRKADLALESVLKAVMRA